MLWSPILHRRGCPIRRSTDLTLIYSSPWLIAVSRVLRRLLMPRHSPYALLCLNFFFSYLLLWVSQIIFVTMKKLLSLLSLIFRHFWRLIVVFYPISFSEKPDFKILKKLSVRFNIFIRFSMIFHLFSPYIIAVRFSCLAAATCRWWAQVDSNHRPRAYQARALTCWAMSPFS